MFNLKTHLGQLYTQIKSRDHAIVRAQKRVQKLSQDTSKKM